MGEMSHLFRLPQIGISGKSICVSNKVSIDQRYVPFYKIPKSRSSRSIVRSEVERVRTLKAKIDQDAVATRQAQVLERPDNGSDTVSLGIYAGASRSLNVPVVNQNGIYSADESLKRIDLTKAYELPGYDLTRNSHNQKSDRRMG